MILTLGRAGGLDDPFGFARVLVRRGFAVRTAKRVIDDLSAVKRAFAWTPADADREALKLEARRHGVEIKFPVLRYVDVRRLRERLGATQEAFAGFYGLDLDTVQNWEQARTKPDRSALALLHLIDTDPEGIIELLCTR